MDNKENKQMQMKRTLLSSMTMLVVLLVGFLLTACRSADSREPGSADQNQPGHHHSH